MDELREKLVAQDASFDDRVVELFKVLLVYSNQLRNRENFEDIVRHEIDHAVHEMKSDLFNE